MTPREQLEHAQDLLDAAEVAQFGSPFAAQIAAQLAAANAMVAALTLLVAMVDGRIGGGS
jgi:hypothetical protein